MSLNSPENLTATAGSLILKWAADVEAEHLADAVDSALDERVAGMVAGLRFADEFLVWLGEGMSVAEAREHLAGVASSMVAMVDESRDSL